MRNKKYIALVELKAQLIDVLDWAPLILITGILLPFCEDIVGFMVSNPC